MIDLTKKKEKTLIDNFTHDYSEIVDKNFETEGRLFLKEFRNPNMLIDNIKQSFTDQEEALNRLKQSITNFRYKIDKVKELYFKLN